MSTKEVLRRDGHNASLNLSKVAGIFYILMGGMIASMLAALGEFLYRSRIEARKGNVTSLLGSLAVSPIYVATYLEILFSCSLLSVKGLVLTEAKIAIVKR
ncbi:unnamed protein product [Gongylonema pulchrum]|uniref:ABC transmembrane type-1 domain-containing protein n=1 Tax=Gongylonema pulchrum TaxID=637853 RepID=A0A183D9Z6_9BILA|nr:unnamed protein product [Gongylonema pulchrum]